MTEGESLYQAILAEPQANDLRLIYADWLEENGDPERAEFIRVQVQLAQMPVIVEDPLTQTINGVPKISLFASDQAKADEAKALLRLIEKRKGLLAREEDLWYAPARGFPPRGHLPGNWLYTIGGFGEGVVMPQAILRRGFIDRIGATFDFLQEHLPAIIKLHPVTRVVATDKDPDHEEDNLWRWNLGSGDPDRVPKDVFDALEGFYDCDQVEKLYLSRRAALDSLSEALLKLASS